MGYSDRALKEAKAIQKKAERRGIPPEGIKGRDLVRLRRLVGTTRKNVYRDCQETQGE